MARKKAPKRVLDYGLEWITDIHIRSSHSTFTLQGRTPYDYLTGETPDKSFDTSCQKVSKSEFLLTLLLSISIVISF